MKVIFLSVTIFCLSFSSASAVQPGGVSIHRTDASATLLLNGEPFVIKGVGGSGSLPLLRRCGGNAVRTWGIDENTGATLDEAHRLGIKVVLGYWLGHERHGFSYTDWDSVVQQADALFDAVKEYKDHPALLMWAIGNEMEGFTADSNPAIYTQIEYLSRTLKQLDSNHPVMTVTAEIGKRQVEALNRFCPSIDIHGINSYGGVTSIPRRYREKGGVKPYIITEYGPPGTWESEPGKWGMPRELSSTDKAAFYQRAFETVHADPLCLGSFAFTWGSKQEASATWFGMLLPTGERTACVDALSKLWTGKPLENLSPVIESIELRGPNELLNPGAQIEVKLICSDPEGDQIDVKWVLAEDWKETAEGGDYRPTPPLYPHAILDGSTAALGRIRIPDGGGTYRVYAYVYDGNGGGATANLSINVKGPRKPVPAQAIPLPLTITGAEQNSPWVPSGWMGDHNKMKLDEHCADNPKEGRECTKVSFTSDTGWAGVVWQHPAGDWGDGPGGFDLTGAKQLSFWARGAKGGEKATIGIGIIGTDKMYHDTVRKEVKLSLSADWKRYEIDLSDSDLTRVKSALYFSTASDGEPFAFYLDAVRIQ